MSSRGSTSGRVSRVVTTRKAGRPLFALFCVALLLASCTTALPAPTPASSATSGVPLPTATGTPATLGALFDPPPPAPGYQWTRNGVGVSFSELSTAAGSEHCDSQSATFLRIGWPLGTVANSRLDSRQYIRDPQGVIIGQPFRQRLDRHATLPTEARPTGYRYGTVELHLSPRDQDEFIYVIGPAGAERWPRSDPMTLCF